MGCRSGNTRLLSFIRCNFASRKYRPIDDCVPVDRAIKNGFAFDLGPFETWDTLGVERVVARMKFEDLPIAPLVEKMLAKGITSFYRWEHGVPVAQLNPKTLAYDAILEDKRVIILKREEGRGSRIVAMSFCEPRSWTRVLSS